MRQEFSGYYYPKEEEFETLWSECTFVFDANMLINLYRFPKDSREAMITIMENVKDRIWIPHQVALEYHKHLHEEIFNQKNAYKQFEEKCNDSINELIADLVGMRHSNIESKGIEKVLKECQRKIRDELNKQSKSQPDLLDIQDQVKQLIGNKIGEPFSKEELEELFKMGESRYLENIPPGFKDRTQKKNLTTLHDGLTYKDEYGDFIYWQQILDKAKEDDSVKSIILITDDSKEDWVYKVKGEKKGPHPELIHEFKKKTEGKQFYLYNSERFLEYAKVRLKLEDSYLDTAKVTGAIEGIKELKKNDFQYELSNLRANKELNMDFKELKKNHSLYWKTRTVKNNANPKDDLINRIYFVLNLEGELSAEERISFSEDIKKYTLILYNTEVTINLRQKINLGDRFLYNFEIESTKRLADDVLIFVEDLAEHNFASKKPKFMKSSMM